MITPESAGCLAAKAAAPRSAARRQIRRPAARPLMQLTEHERVALTVIAAGYTQAHAARLLRISPSTLRRAIRSASLRLGAKSIAQAIALALLEEQLDRSHIRARTVPAWPGRFPYGHLVDVGQPAARR